MGASFAGWCIYRDPGNTNVIGEALKAGREGKRNERGREERSGLTYGRASQGRRERRKERKEETGLKAKAGRRRLRMIVDEEEEETKEGGTAMMDTKAK